MPTNENEGTADREYHDDRHRNLVFEDLTHPVVGVWLIGICVILTVVVVIAAVAHWIG